MYVPDNTVQSGLSKSESTDADRRYDLDGLAGGMGVLPTRQVVNWTGRSTRFGSSLFAIGASPRAGHRLSLNHRILTETRREFETGLGRGAIAEAGKLSNKIGMELASRIAI